MKTLASTPAPPSATSRRGPLQPSDEVSKWIVRSTPDGYWVFDEQGRTTFANDRLAEMLGRTPAEMLGLSVFDTLDDVGKEQFRGHLAALAEEHDGVDNLECSLVRGDGTRIWVLVGYSPLLDDDGARRGWVHRVTELHGRQRLLDRVSTSESQLAEAQAIAKVGSWEWDVSNDVVTWSDELYRLLNLQPQQFAATYAGFLDCVHPADRSTVEAAVGAALTGQSDAFEFEARLLPHGGGEMWTRGRGKVERDHSGAPVRMSGTSQDITDSIQAARALAETSAQLEVLQTMTAAANEAETLSDAVAIAMVELARHTGWVGHATHTVDEHGALHVMHDLRADGASVGHLAPGRWAAKAAADRSTAWGEQPEPGHGGRHVIAFPVVADGTVACVLEFAIDDDADPRPNLLETIRQVASQLGRVAERDRSRRELAAARDAAMEASRMKSDFLATMSHEIRTPMNGVIGLTGLLLNSELDYRQRRYAEGVRRAGEGLLAIINDILDFSKIEAGKLELETVDFDLVQAIEEAVELVAQEVHRKELELLAYLSGTPISIGPARHPAKRQPGTPGRSALTSSWLTRISRQHG